MNSWTRRTLLFGALGATALLIPQPWNASTRAQSAAQRAHGIENFDLRLSKGGPGREHHVRARHDRGARRRDGIAQRGQARAIGRQQLAERVPRVQIQDGLELGTPEIVRVPRGRAHASASLTSLADESRPQAVKRFLGENADVFGLTAQQVSGLEEKGDYANPDGGLAFVELEQKANGRSVFRGTLRAVFDASGELFQTVGQLAPDLDYASLTAEPTLDAAAAAQAAAAAVGLEVAAGEFLAAKDDGDNVVLDGPFVRQTNAELVYFPLEPGVAALAWSMVLWEKDLAWYMIIDAEDGELLFRKNITNEALDATYVVYDADSPTPLSPTTDVIPGDGPGVQPPLIPRTAFTLQSEHPLNDPWLPDLSNTTTGNNVDAGMDLLSPNGIDAGSRPIGSPSRVFNFPYNPSPGNPAPGDSPTLANYRFGEAVQMFFWTNRYHDRLWALGFNEQSGNFQQDNFGRGGLGNDRVLAEGQDFSETNNANFDTPPDGTSGRMQMFIFTGPTPDRTSGLDQEIVIHELTHGTSNRLHANATGLSSVMSRGMGEGWSDFFARSLLSGPDEDPNGVYAVGAYSTLRMVGVVPEYTDNYFYGIRRFPYAVRSTVGPNGKPYNPLTFADIDGAQIDLTDGAYPRGPLGSTTAFQVHNIGEVWCMALLEVRARLIDRMGWAAGNQRMMQLVVDGMKLDPAEPTLVNGRDSILAASAASGGGPEEERDIWAGFATRGLGASASAFSPTSPTVVEAFDLPTLELGPVTIADDSFDHSGYADPGETLVLNIPLVNPLLSTTAVGTTAEITGATPALVSYGDIAGGATVSRQFTFTVPLSTPCGSLLAFTVEVDSSLGPISLTFSLPVGAPTGTIPFEYSSGSIAVPIPEVGTTEVPIEVPDTGIVDDVVVRLRLNHTFDRDLAISLVAPDGTTVPLSMNRGDGGDNFGNGPNDCSGTFTVFDDAAGTAIGAGTAPFAGSFRPDAPLAGFRGKSMAGTWKLRVIDGSPLDSGALGCVQLRIRKQLFFCVGVAGTPNIVAAPPEVIAESAEPANLAPDPDETVTMSLALGNVGTGLTGDLVATLLPGGGVNAPSAPQSYGVVSPVGDAVARAFTFVASGNCGENITATFHLQDGALDLGNVSFTLRLGTTVKTQAPPVSNRDAVAIRDTPRVGGMAPSSPYPSTLEVSGLHGTVSKVTVRLYDLSHTFPGDIDVLLVGPGGQRMVLMSDAGGGTDVVNVDVSFDDDAPTLLPAPLVSGTFRPTNLGTAVDVFPAPAPAAPHGAALSVFNGTDPNGAWSLYVVDDTGQDSGNIVGGWTITITTTAPVCVTSPCLLRVPDDLARSNDAGQCGAIVAFAPTGVSGSCGVVTTSQASGSFFPVGATVVTSTGTRQDGSTTTASFDVAVSDVEGPVLAQPVASPSSLWPPNHKLRPVQVSWSATDNCTAAGSIVGALSVSSNEPVNGLGHGDKAPDWIVDGLHAVRLRAERSRRGSGRIYTVASTVTDQYGNATTKTVPVLVPRRGPKAANDDDHDDDERDDRDERDDHGRRSRRH
jgi:extracellular elastinolytic metalloproteinase